MVSLNLPFSLMPFLYFCPVRSGNRLLLITDHLERLQLDFTLFNLTPTFCVPRHFEKRIVNSDHNSVIFFDDKNTDFLQHQYDIILLDLETAVHSDHISEAAIRYDKNATLIIFDWSLSRLQALKNLPRLLGWTKDGKSNLLDNLYFPRGPGLNLEWYFLIAPALGKPRHFVEPTLNTDIPTWTSSHLKDWAHRKGYFYMQPHHKVIISTTPSDDRAAIQDPVTQVVKTLIGSLKTEEEIRNSITRIYISTTNALLIRVSHENDTFYIRFPFTDSSIRRVERQKQLTTFLFRHGTTLIPKPIEIPIDSPFPCYIEQAIPGACADRSHMGDSQDRMLFCYRQALETIAGIHQRFGKFFRMQELPFKRYIQTKIDAIRNRLRTNQFDAAFRNIAEHLWVELKDKSFLAGVCHGDLKIENCLYDKQWRITGIIDWDMGSMDELTLVDLSSLLAKTIRELRSMSIAELVLTPRDVPDPFVFLYRSYFEMTHTSFIEPKTAFLIYWIDRVYKQLTFSPDLKESWNERNVYPVLEKTDVALRTDFIRQ